MRRLYENENLTIFWNSDKCRHAKECVTRCPGVFDIQKKPWININGAPDAETWQAVSHCPSGALTCTYNHDVSIEFDEANRRSVARLNGEEIGECDYDETPSGWRIYHTGVSPEFTGKNIAKRLVYKLLEEADKRKIAVDPVCSYAAKVVAE